MMRVIFFLGTNVLLPSFSFCLCRWGGVDYEVFGKNGYDLKKNMKIRISPEEDDYEADGDGFRFIGGDV